MLWDTLKKRKVILKVFELKDKAKNEESDADLNNEDILRQFDFFLYFVCYITT